MRTVLFLSLTLFSATSFAGKKFVCKEQTATSPRRFVFTQVGDTVMRELSRYNFLLEIFTPNVRTPVVKEVVTVSFEDVMVKVTNRAKKINAMVYMDEPTDSWMKIGAEEIRLNCPEVNL